MKHTRRPVILFLALAALALAGCSASGPAADSAGIAPGMLAPEADVPSNRMVLGAGDAWGRLIYVQYLASLERAEDNETAYAIVDTDADGSE